MTPTRALTLFASLGAASAAIWPNPSALTNGSSTIVVAPGEAFFDLGSASSCNTLAQAAARYQQLAFPHPSADESSAVLPSLAVAVEDLDESHPTLTTDESYSLNVPADGSAASLTAATVYGALRGLETFSQLVVFDFENRQYFIDGAPWQIDDAPRFPHRGLMIDTARHFLPIAAVKKVCSSAKTLKDPEKTNLLRHALFLHNLSPISP